MEAVQTPQQEDPYMMPSDLGYTPPPAQPDDQKFNFMRWQLDTDSLIEDIEYTLKGFKKVKVNNEIKWEQRGEKKSDRLMNDKGISRIMAVLNMRLSRLGMLSDLDEEKIALFAKDCADSVNDLLYTDGEEFQINLSDVPIINQLVYDSVYITLRRSYKGGERRFISLVERAIEQYMVRNDTQPKGIGIPNPMRGLFRK